MSDTQNESAKPDYLKDLMLWGVLVLSTVVLLAIKPKIIIHQRSMYLPKITNLKTIDKNKVKLIQENNFANYFMYNKVGFITITLPNDSDNISQMQFAALDQALSIAADAGADKLFVEYMVTTPWFDTNKTVFRMQAVALKQ